MPQGYIVTLGNNSLDNGDAISGGLITFTTDTVLGTGSWTWSGTYAGTTYTNETEPGDYYLATNGNVYFVSSYGPVTTLSSASATSAPAYAPADGIVSGTSGNDVIDDSFTDTDGDTVTAGADSIIAGTGNDTVIAGGGDDSITGGDGNDTIYGDFTTSEPAATATTEHLSWISQQPAGTNIAGGFVQDTGDMNVAVTFVNDGSNTGVQTNASTQYTGGGPYAANSALNLTGDGGPNVTATFDFSAQAGSGQMDVVSDVSFIINDVDLSGWQDIITVNAYDAAGNPVSVTLSPYGNDTVSGNTVTGAGGTNDTQASANGAVQVTIADPVASFEIIYSNGGTSGQALWVTDVHYTTIPQNEGDDSIDGGAGADTIYGGGGEDTIVAGSENDTVFGGTGNDSLFGGADDDSIIGGDGDDSISGGTGNDTIHGDQTPLPPTFTVQYIDINGATNNTEATTLDTYFDMTDGSIDVVSNGAAPSGAVFQVDAFGTTTTDDIDPEIQSQAAPTGIGYGDTQGHALVYSTQIDVAGGTYTFDADFYNSAALYIDGQQVFISESLGANTASGTVTLSPGEHDVVILYAKDISATAEDLNMSISGGEFGSIPTPFQNAPAFGATTGTGDDTIDGGAGDDSIIGGTGDDRIVFGDGFGVDSVDGSEDADFADVDTLDASTMTTDATLDLSGVDPETGTLTSGANVATFDNIEAFTLGSGDDSVIGSDGDDSVTAGAGADTINMGTGSDTVDLGAGSPDGEADVVVLQDGFGDDIVTNFDAPTPVGDGTFAGIDTLDVSGLYDLPLGDPDRTPVLTNDVTVTDDGSGNALLTFPNGETIVLDGISPIDADDPFYLNAIGIPMPDGTVSGTTGDDVIDGSYMDDPDGDIVDNDDAIISGHSANDDLIEAGAGNDTILSADGNDTIFGGTGDDIIEGGAGADVIQGESGDDTIVINDGFGDDTIVGGETGETNGDTVDGSGLTQGVNVTFTGAEAGQIDNGPDLATFSEIELVETGSGDDTITGTSGVQDVITGAGNDTVTTTGTGADTIQSGAGDDTITFSEGDSIDGGSGDDTFLAEDLGEPTNGTINIDGGDGGETADDSNPLTLEGDTLQLGTLADLSTLVKVSDGLNDDGNETFHGSVTMDDDTILTFLNIENIICFTSGTRIATPHGERDIATLRAGDLVVTRDHGLQPIRWIEQRTVPAIDHFAPIRIRPGVVTGQQRDLLVSPQHRMMFQGCRAELLFGQSEVLVAAKHLVDDTQVTRDFGGDVTYIHMMFDQHEVVYAEGAATESFHPGDVGLTAISDPAREELFALFPSLRTNPNGYGQTARRCLKKYECELLVY